MGEEGTETPQCLTWMHLALNSEHKKTYALHRWDTKIYILSRDLQASQQEMLEKKMNESESWE